MDNEYIDIQSEYFDEIVEDIKQRNLSKNNMPKLIVGTGLSIVYGVPGMVALAKYLNEEIHKSGDEDIKKMWDRRYASIKEKGLEAGLVNLTPEEDLLVDKIKPMTAGYILENEEVLHKEILEKNSGFSRLMAYLSRTASVNKKLIDIMTPNYDRIIEIVCDKLGIGVITGFAGSLYCRFNKNLMRQPADVYNYKKSTWVRLFKPHGSLNWINEDGNEYLTNDYNVLQKKVNYIEIVTPGSSKYKASLINSTFRRMREEFNELLNVEDNYSLLIYGYGFNDDHFDAALFDSFQKNVLILAREVKQEIIDKALEKRNITVFYHKEDKEYMIYKSRKYTIDLPLWDMDKFTEIFLG